VAKVENLKPKPLTYPVIIFVLFFLFGLFQVVDSWQQECDYSVDNLVGICIGLLWVTQPRHLRQRDLGPLLILVACYKAVYFIDREYSLNTPTDETLQTIKDYVLNNPIIYAFLPLGFQFVTENKINRLYRFGRVHALISHSLTAIVGAFYFIKYLQAP